MQRVNLPEPRSEAVRRCPRVTAGDRSLPPVLARNWHGARWPSALSVVDGIPVKVTFF